MSQALLSLSGVKNAGPGKGLSNAVDLTICCHEVVCLSGPSGSGKTLLLRAIADLDPVAGELCLGDRLRQSMAAPDWRREVVFVPSESAWWAPRARDHFHCSARNLERLGLGEDVMDRDLSRLSSGERQRLSLLRAMALVPAVLLLDEPTSAVDENSMLSMERLVREYVDDHQAAACWVSHDPGQIDRIADRHLMVVDGSLVAVT